TLRSSGGTYSGSITLSRPLTPTQVATNSTIPGETLVAINGAVTVSQNTTFSMTTAALTFGSAVDDSAAGAHTLTVNGSLPDTFAGAVGSGQALASLTTDAGGATVLNGGSVKTTGGQSYGDAVTLGAAGTATRLTGTDISFAATVRSAADGQQALTVAPRAPPPSRAPSATTASASPASPRTAAARRPSTAARSPPRGRSATTTR